MLADGLLDEVESLRTRYRLTEQLPAMRCVGYRQAWACIEGRIDRNALRDQGIYATRQLAKRQLTWLRGLPTDVSLDCRDPLIEQQFEALVRTRFGC
jgi:tRNA dimethylallyltransferase